IRPISRDIVGLNDLADGFYRFYFNLTIIVILRIYALLVLFIAQFLLQRYIKTGNVTLSAKRVSLIALAISLGWALHPINLTNVLYVVQRMNSLSSLFVLAGILFYIRGRMILDTAPLKGWSLILISPILFLPLAWFSKENGGLLPLFLFIIELTIFRFHTESRIQKKGLYLFYFLFLFLPSLLVLLYLIEHSYIILGGYGNRHFSLTERLMTESRILWIYIQMILLPVPSLFGLFLDDIPISTSLTQPNTTLPAILSLCGLFIIALLSIKRAPALAFGLLFFFAGHLMESTVVPLELAFEHRNYLPAVGLLFPLFYYLGHGLLPDKVIYLRTIAISALIILFALQTHLRAWTWSNNVLLYLTTVEHHPNSARANYEAGKVYGQMLERGQGNPETNYQNAVRYLERSASLRKSSTSGLFGIILASIDSGNKIQASWIEELEHRLATQPLEQVNIVWLNRLTECVSKNECDKDDIQIPRLANAAIRYPLADKRNRAQLYAVLARYAFSVEVDPVKSVKMARMAVSLMPSNLYHKISLANYLLSINHRIEAAELLANIERDDIYHQHKKNIDTLKDILNNN
ncbi:MAG: hypothetical protein ACN4GR_15095, partial [Arenicellales bacterium]